MGAPGGQSLIKLLLDRTFWLWHWTSWEIRSAWFRTPWWSRYPDSGDSSCHLCRSPLPLPAPPPGPGELPQRQFQRLAVRVGVAEAKSRWTRRSHISENLSRATADALCPMRDRRRDRSHPPTITWHGACRWVNLIWTITRSINQLK